MTRIGKINLRNAALTSVSAAALMLGASGAFGAPAPVSNYFLDLTGTLATISTQSQYLIIAGVPQLEVAPVGAVIDGSSVTNVYGVGTGFPTQASNNSFTATAIASFAGSVLPSDRIINLAAIGNDGTNDGIGILSSQVTGVTGLFTPIPVTASIDGGTFGNTMIGYSTGSVDTSGNTLSASTTVNQISPDYQVRGIIPNTYSSAVQGSSAGDFNATTLTITNSASVAITSVQTALNAGALGGSFANITNANIGDIIAPNAAPLTVLAPQTVNNNTVSADFTGNSSHNIFLAEIGGNPTFNASVLVSNNQANIEIGGSIAPIYTALVSGANVAIYDVGGAPNYVSLGGLADISGNSVSASSTGNAAGAGGVDGGAPTIGNAIAFANGLNVIGTGTTAGNVLNIPSSNVLHSALSADLILSNGQGNQGTQIGAAAEGVAVYVRADDVTSTGTVNLAGNSVGSAATGNVAVGTIQAQGGATVNATVVAASLQTNDATPIFATTSLNAIGAELGGGLDGTTNGAISVLNNSIGATATGSLAGDPTVRTIALDATSLTSTGGLATIQTASQWSNGPIQTTTGGGISASNLQANFGVNTPISADVAGNAIGALLGGNLGEGSIGVNGNSIGAAASGNVGYTSVALSGSNGAFSAGVSNTQYNANPIGALGEANAIAAIVPGTVDSSTIVLAGNSLTASGVANSANNSLTATGFATLVLGSAVANTWAGVNQNTWYDPGVPQFSNRVTGALALSNNQTNDGNVTASLADSGSNPLDVGFVYAAVGSVIGGSSIAVNTNVGGTSAIGAQATNTLTLGGGDMTTASGTADMLATLGSVQYQGGPNGSTGVAISSTVDLTGAFGAYGIVAEGGVANSSLTVNTNALSAFAAGNLATNTLTASGTNYASAAPGVPLSSIQQLGFREQAEFALQNMQFDNAPANGNTAGSRTASITGAYVGIALTAPGTIDTAPLTVSGNSLDADARNNYASNTLGLTGFSSLSTSAALQNFQNSISTVNASVNEGKIGIDADGYDTTNSDLTVTDNFSRARAIANTAFNTLNVGSNNQLGGNSGNTGATASMTNLPDLLQTYTVTADYALASYQGTTQSATATVTGVFQIDLTTGGIAGGSATLSGNSMTAVAQSNNGVNALNIAGGTTTALSGALLSEQRAIAATTSATAGYGSDGALAGIQVGSADGTPMSVSGNSLTAIAGNNSVTNTLNASATSNLTGVGLIATATVANLPLDVSVNADFALFNVQIASGGSVSATANPGQLGVHVDGSTDGSPISVLNNTVTAQARVNDAGNTLALNGTNVSSTASLANWQQSDNTSTASITAGAVGVSNGNPGPTTIGTSPLNVSGNTFSAAAAGNNASNTLSVTAVNYGTPINAASGGSVVGGGYQSTADYAVLNMQQNNGTVSSTVTGLNVGVNIGNGTPPSVTNSPMTVSGNMVVASAYGNSASNSITMSATVGTLPSASLTSSQVNTAAVNSTVTGAVIGINVGANTGSSGVSSNNAVSAVAIGNSVGNSIGIH